VHHGVKPLFQTHLVNGHFGDPVVYVDFLFDRRALLFDLGTIRNLPPRKIMRLTDIFVSHTHMDHFNDFDWLVRLCLGRPVTLRLYGPEGFIDRVEHRLRGYTWNLAAGYAESLTLVVTELHEGERGRAARFECRHNFTREAEGTVDLPGNVLLQALGFRVRATLLDHGIPCLAFALEEQRHISVRKNHLAELGLSTGPWLKGLKQAVLQDAPDDTPILLDDGRTLPLGRLRDAIIDVTPGSKTAYVVDCAYTPENRTRIIELARDADELYIEAAFTAADAVHAENKRHLTGMQAGQLGRAAGVKRLHPIHCSPRYQDQGGDPVGEAQRAFAGE
jgi:ribonuclease Z